VYDVLGDATSRPTRSIRNTRSASTTTCRERVGTLREAVARRVRGGVETPKVLRSFAQIVWCGAGNPSSAARHRTGWIHLLRTVARASTTLLRRDARNDDDDMRRARNH